LTAHGVYAAVVNEVTEMSVAESHTATAAACLRQAQRCTETNCSTLKLSSRVK